MPYTRSFQVAKCLAFELLVCWCGSSNPVFSCMFIAIISWVARSGLNLLQSIQSVKFPARTPLYAQRLWIVLRCHLLQSIQHVHRKWNWTCLLSCCCVVATMKAKSCDAPFPYSITLKEVWFIFCFSYPTHTLLQLPQVNTIHAFAAVSCSREVKLNSCRPWHVEP